MSLNVENPHRRFDPLSGSWVLVSPHRAKRPWLGQTEKSALRSKLAFEKDCFLCPTNKRVTGETNPDYRGTFVFQNDFSALLENSLELPLSDAIFKIAPARGEARVVCFSPDHSKTIADMDVGEIKKVIDCWRAQSLELGQKYKWVQIFENKGEIMGCSNPHPHGQIWACDFIPTIAQNEINNQNVWYEEHGANLLLKVLEREIILDERVVFKNDNWAVIVPFWARWPYETLVLPRINIQRFDEVVSVIATDLADALLAVTKKYDALFDCPFPYSMGWHGAPYDGKNYPQINLHAHFYPPLLRSASVKKFMVGFEMLAEEQRDLTPEQAANQLKSL